MKIYEAYSTRRGKQVGTMPAFPRRKAGPGTPQSRYAPHDVRVTVYQRDAGQCQYCGEAVTLEACCMDHVIPWNLGGRTEPSNLVTACPPCNKAKGRAVIPYDLKPI